MNLEKYRDQMAERFPSAGFTEETLSNLKNRNGRLRLPLKAVGKGLGTAAVLTAAAFTIVAGTNFFRGIFAPIRESDPPSEEVRELSPTPLANPDHALKAVTENGTITLDENATAEEMIAAGAVVDGAFGFVGYRQICELFRALRAGEEYELILATLPYNPYLSSYREYQRVKLNADGTVDGKTYRYEEDKQYLTTYPFERARSSYHYGAAMGYISAETGCEKTMDSPLDLPFGMALNIYTPSSAFVGVSGYITVCSVSDYLAVTGFSDERAVEIYMTVMEHLPDLPGINLLYGGEYSSPEQLPLFLALAESEDVDYCSTTILSIAPLSETADEAGNARYGECFYALEYLNGRYRIFTMKNGFEGEYDEQLFDRYTVANGELIFENGNVTYRFPYENVAFTDPFQSYADYRNTAADVLNFNVISHQGTGIPWASGGKGTGALFLGVSHKDEKPVDALSIWELDYRTTDYTEPKTGFQKLLLDPFYFRTVTANINTVFRIDETLCEPGLYAIEIDSCEEMEAERYVAKADGTGYEGTVVPGVRIVAAVPERNESYRLLKGVSLDLYKDECDLRETPEGKTYLMLSQEQWESMTWYTRDIQNTDGIVSYTLYAQPAWGK